MHFVVQTKKRANQLNKRGIIENQNQELSEEKKRDDPKWNSKK